MTNKMQGYFTHFVGKDRMGERNKLEFSGQLVGCDGAAAPLAPSF
jgi:hypothetical protein